MRGGRRGEGLAQVSGGEAHEEGDEEGQEGPGEGGQGEGAVWGVGLAVLYCQCWT